jgi:hypothetical protein
MGHPGYLERNSSFSILFSKKLKLHFYAFKIQVDFFCRTSRLDGNILTRIISKDATTFELKILVF